MLNSGFPRSGLGRFLLLAALSMPSAPLAALAQEQAPSVPPAAPPVESPSTPAEEPPAQETPVPEPTPGERAQMREQERLDAEREMKKIRARYFRSMRNVEVRQIGIRKLREFTDPRLFPAMLEIFKREKQDVRGAILDHLADQQTDEGDTTLAWAAIFDEDEWFRQQAAERLKKRIAASGEASWRVRTVVAQGLKRKDEKVVAAAAQLAHTLKLVEAIPMLINAQISGGGGGGSEIRESRDGALGWILIGQQQAFVADLEPVVADNAVAFDPELAVVTSGTFVRVIDAVAVTYRVDVHNALVGLSSEAWGRSTAHLGWDNAQWREWYTREFLPEYQTRRKLRAGPGADGPR